MWELRCVCGNTTYSPAYCVTGGNTTSCGCYHKELVSRIGKTLHKRKYHPRITTARYIWQGNCYKDCSFETFLKLSQEPCYYCGTLPKQTRNAGNKKGWNASPYQLQDGYFTYNGLDRIDSNKGHTDDNVVPCCINCNQAKMDLSLEAFLLHVERMYEGTKQLRKLLTPPLGI